MMAQCRKLLVKTLLSFWVNIFFDTYERNIILYSSHYTGYPCNCGGDTGYCPSGPAIRLLSLIDVWYCLLTPYGQHGSSTGSSSESAQPGKAISDRRAEAWRPTSADPADADTRVGWAGLDWSIFSRGAGSDCSSLLRPSYTQTPVPNTAQCWTTMNNATLHPNAD